MSQGSGCYERRLQPLLDKGRMSVCYELRPLLDMGQRCGCYERGLLPLLDKGRVSGCYERELQPLQDMGQVSGCYKNRLQHLLDMGRVRTGVLTCFRVWSFLMLSISSSMGVEIFLGGGCSFLSDAWKIWNIFTIKKMIKHCTQLCIPFLQMTYCHIKKYTEKTVLMPVKEGAVSTAVL